MLTCILGRADSPKSALLRRRLGEARAQGIPCVMIVPEQYTLQAELDIIEQLKLPGLLDIEVLSFSRLPHRVFALSGGPKQPVIDALGRAMLVRRALSELEKTNAFCARSADRPGFAAGITDTLSELKAFGVTPDMLARAAVDERGIKSERLEALAAVYERVEGMMAGQFSDGEDLLDLLAQKLPQTGLFRRARVFIDGFESLSGKWMGVIEQLIRTCKGVDITFCVPEGGEEDAWVFESEVLAYNQVAARARMLDCGVESIRLRGEAARPAALAHLERYLFDPGVKKYCGDMQGLEFMRAADAELEADGVAARIVRLHKETGCAWREMAVIVPNVRSDARVFRRVFARYGIPCFVDDKRPLTGHPLVRCVLSALHAAEANYPQREMIELMKTGLGGIGLAEGQLLENHVLARGAKGRSFLSAFEDPGAEALRARLTAPLTALEKALKQDRTARGQAQAVKDYLAAVRAGDALDAMHARLELEGEPALLEASRQAMDTLVSILDQAAALLGEVAMGRGEFIGLLRSALEQEDVGIIPTSEDAVLVGSWERTQLPSVKALFVTGCADGAFPPVPPENPLLGDEERDFLNRSGLKTGPDTRMKWTIAQLRVYKALALPTELLHISVAAADSRGALSDAHLLKKLFRMFPGAHVGGSAVDSGLAVTGAQSAFSEIARRLGGNGPVPEEWRAAFHVLYADPAWRERLDALRGAVEHALPPPRVKIPSDRGLLPRVISVSQLERFAGCPFQYFVQYGLKPAERKVFELSRMDAGSYLHAAMESVQRKIMALGEAFKSASDEETDALIEAAVRETQERLEADRMLGDPLTRYWSERLLETVRFCARHLIEELLCSEFSLAAVEIELEDAVLESGGLRVPFKGRIDRVDVLRQGETEILRLVDYKSYAKKLEFGRVFHGLDIQLPVYAHALLAQVRREGRQADIGALLYAGLDYPVLNTEKQGAEAQVQREQSMRRQGKLISDPQVLQKMDSTLEPGVAARFIPVALTGKGAVRRQGNSALSGEEMRAFLDRAVQAAREIMAAISAGEIAPVPAEDGKGRQCARCAFRPICRFDASLPGARVRRLSPMNGSTFFEKAREGADA